MAKKVRSFNISDDAFKVVEDYKEKYHLGNNSVALDKLLLDYNKGLDENMKKSIRNLVEEILIQRGYNKEISPELINEEANEVMDEVAQASLDSMNEMLKEIGLK